MTKPTMWLCAQRRLRSASASAWSDQALLSAWRKLESLDTQWAHSEDSDQTGQMPRLIWVFAGRTCHFVGFDMRQLKCLLLTWPNFRLKPYTLIRSWEKVCDKVRHKLVFTHTEASDSLGILDIQAVNSEILIRLHRCQGWSASLLFPNGINGLCHDVAQIYLLAHWSHW